MLRISVLRAEEVSMFDVVVQYFRNFGRPPAVAAQDLPMQQDHTWPILARVGTVVAIVVGGLFLDEATPQMLSVGVFYVAAVLTGFWFPKSTDVLALALLATSLIVVAYWITTPDPGTVWEAWTNRALTIGTVWLTSLFVWYIRILQQRLRQQIEITHSLSREISHRVGNSLQIVASFLRLQASRGASDETRHILEAASSRVMAIGRIERMLSHAGAGHLVDSRAFLTALISDTRSALSDPDRLGLTVAADSAELTSSLAIPLGACLIELINNALKHAFNDSSRGTIDVRFTALSTRYVVEVEDNGAGLGESRGREGFGTQNVAELARLMRGSISHQAAHPAADRPGTVWRLVIPRD